MRKINHAVGFRLITRAGTPGAVNLSKFVPFVGDVVGGSVDAAVTYSIGTVARSVFTGQEPEGA